MDKLSVFCVCVGTKYPDYYVLALRDMVAGKEVIKYGRTIGKARKDIAKGAHVHTQNVVSIRWETSVDE